MENTRFKLIVVGDGAVGKTSMLISFVIGCFPERYIPTVFENYVDDIVVDGKPYEVALWDTGGGEDYWRLRPLSYPETDIFLLCFSVESPDSLDNISTYWIPELNHHMPDTPRMLVGCKKDLGTSVSDLSTLSDLRTKVSDACRLLKHEEGVKTAKECGMPYIETSALTGDGIKACFDEAIRLALRGRSTQKKKKSGLRGMFYKKPSPGPPEMPQADKAPCIEVETSMFAENWQKALEDPVHTDVVFQLESKHCLKAHKVVLCSGTDFFCKVFGIIHTHNNQLNKVNFEAYTEDQLNQGQVAGISGVYTEMTEDKQATQTVIEMASDVKRQYFVHVLEFLYTGVPKFQSDNRINELDNVINLSHMLDIPLLETICVNIKNDEVFLNPSIVTYYNDQMAQRMKDMFLNQTTLADVVFKVEGQDIYAHKCVLTARSEVMAAMLSRKWEGHSLISEIALEGSSVTFLALLEYLYTDHASIEEGDSVGILMLANQYCQSRFINLCELYISKEVDRSVTNNIEKSDIDVIGLLLMSQIHNANQLDKWCLHFIASNYSAFQLRPEFSQLKGENKEYVEEHQWPPISYLQEVAKYKKQIGKHGEKCFVM